MAPCTVPILKVKSSSALMPRNGVCEKVLHAGMSPQESDPAKMPECSVHRVNYRQEERHTLPDRFSLYFLLIPMNVKNRKSKGSRSSVPLLINYIQSGRRKVVMFGLGQRGISAVNFLKEGGDKGGRVNNQGFFRQWSCRLQLLILIKSQLIDER